MICPRLLFSVLLLFKVVHTIAVPAQAVSQTVKLRNGSAVSLTLIGDEYGHGWFSPDGRLAEMQPDGTWCLLTPTATAHRCNSWQAAQQQSMKQPISRGITTQRKSLKGSKRVLVLLVQFPDKQMSIVNAQSEFDDWFNLKGYKRYGCIGSFADYFNDQSYGQLHLQCDVVGPVTMSNNSIFYGSNVGVDGDDIYPGQMVAEACRAVDDIVDFRRYDWDNDGEVEQVLILYAGYGESSGAPSNTIWPHHSTLEACERSGDGNGILTLDNTKINSYACFCELNGSTGSTITGIGTACHEFGHCLGLPDFYDVSYMGSPGMGIWDIMASGAHNGPAGRGEIPCGYTAYERWFFGWLDFIVITNSSVIKDMPDIGSNPCAYLIRNSAADSEWFILENRQPERWYSYAGITPNCHGLLVTHADINDLAWQRNRVNNNIHHQRMSFIPADSSYGTKLDGGYLTDDMELRGDLFPGSKNVTALTRFSHTDVGGLLFTPAASNSTYLEYTLHNIKEIGKSISFCISDANRLQPPTNITTTVLSSTSFSAEWDVVPDIDNYEAELSWKVSLKPYKREIVNVGNITANSYIFDNIPVSSVNVRFRSVAFGVPSEWSNPIVVQLIPDGIDGPMFSEAGNNYTSDRKWHTISGQCVRKPRQQGLYIVTNGNKRKTIYIQ